MWSDNKHHQDNNTVFKLVKSSEDKADIIILVTHYEYVEDSPTYFANKEFGLFWNDKSIDKGDAWIIDCEHQTRHHMRNSL